MTTDIPNPQEAPTIPPAPDAKLALDEFSEALGDNDMPTPAMADTAFANNPSAKPSSLEAIYDIPVNITVILGRTHIEVSNLLSLDKGDIVELDRKVGEAVDIVVNNRLVARGEIVLVDDRLGITMTEIIKSNHTG